MRPGWLFPVRLRGLRPQERRVLGFTVHSTVLLAMMLCDYGGAGIHISPSDTCILVDCRCLKELRLACGERKQPRVTHQRRAGTLQGPPFSTEPRVLLC